MNLFLVVNNDLHANETTVSLVCLPTAEIPTPIESVYAGADHPADRAVVGAFPTRARRLGRRAALAPAGRGAAAAEAHRARPRARDGRAARPRAREPAQTALRHPRLARERLRRVEGRP